MDDGALSRARQEVERVVRSRPALSSEDADDVVQEALTRLLENRDRLEPSAWPTYAAVSALNLLRDRERLRDVHRRHEHRLHEPGAGVDPEQHLLTAEEHAALRRAFDELQADDAALLRAHYLGDERPRRSTKPATAARLARLRAKLRVSYVLTAARIELPTQRCRPVLESLSSGDRRRQERLGAARHLTACEVCASCAPALVERRRALAGLGPLGWLVGGAGALWELARRHPAQSAGVVTVAAVAAVVLVQVPERAEPPAAPPQAVSAPTPPALDIGGEQVFARVGEPELPLGPASADRVPVQDVPVDEGFWVGIEPGRRMWVQLVGPGESPQQVRPGDVVSFRGQAVPTPPDLPARVGLTDAGGAGELVQAGRHLEVRHADLVVHR